MIRIAMADDHPVVTDGLLMWLAGEPDVEVVATASSLDELEPQLDAAAPDVLVLDFRMPGVRGVRTVAALAARGYTIVIFSLLEEGPTKRALTRCGIKAFVPKSQSAARLVEVVRLVHAGQTHLPDDSEPLPHEQLSDRERLVFDRLIDRCSPKEIAFDLGISTSSVYTFVERVRSKLGVETTMDVIAYAHSMGLV